MVALKLRPIVSFHCAPTINICGLPAWAEFRITIKSDRLQSRPRGG